MWGFYIVAYLGPCKGGGVLESQNPNFKGGEIPESQFQKGRNPKMDLKKSHFWLGMESQNPNFTPDF